MDFKPIGTLKSTKRTGEFVPVRSKPAPQDDISRGVLPYMKPPNSTPQPLPSPAQQTLNKYSTNTFKGDELKQGIKELNALAKQQMRDNPTGDEWKKAIELRDTLQRQTVGTAGAMGLVDALSLGHAKRSYRPEFEGSQAAQPLAYGAGNVAGKLTTYAAMAPVLKGLPVVGKAAGAIGGGIGAGIAKATGGKIAQQAAAGVASRLVADTVLDLAVDTIPETVDNIHQGKSAGEVAKEAGKNLAVNIGFNILAEGVITGAKAIKEARASKQMAKKVKQTVDGLNPAAKQALALETGFESAEDMVKAIDEAAQPMLPRAQAVSKPMDIVNPDSSVGAATSRFDPYSKMVNEHGAIKQGELPRAREIDVPKSTDGKNKVRQFTRTVMEAEATPDEMIPLFEQGVSEGLFSYKPRKDAAALDAAVKSITDKGYSGALEQWGDIVNGRKIASKDDMVLGQMLYSLAAKNGDSETAMKLAAEIAAEGTRMGQGVQAMRMLKKTTPEGKLYYAQKSAESIQKDLVKKYGAKAPTIKIDSALVDNYMGAMKSGEGLDAALDAIEQNIADQLPKTLADKWNAWRYFSMLGNPRTHVRNVVGNALFMGTTKAKNGLAAAIEEGVDKTSKAMGRGGIERTKALVKDPAAVEFAKKDVTEMLDVLQGGGKYNPTDSIRDKQAIFNTKWLEKARKFNMDMLEVEDAAFLKPHYIDSMAGYLSANKLNPANLTPAQLGKARGYAIKEAQRATFRDASAVADGISRLSKTNSATKIFIEGILPFKKTPVNIAKRAVEYSPLGLLNGTKQALFDVSKGTKTAAEAIDTIASGLTGSGIMALGYWLSSQGIITGGKNDDKKQGGFDMLTGGQNYALNIGDKSYTLDWAAPSAIPLFMGAELEARKGKDKTIQEFVNSILKVGDPLIEMSMLQGIDGALQTAGYSESPVFDIPINAAADYLSQGVPTLGGQIARTVDGTRRMTYAEKGDIKLVSTTLQKAQAKLPFASDLLTPRVDAWGREVKQQGGNIASRAAQNMLSPGYYSTSKKTEVETELERLYKKGVENNPYPQIAPRFFNDNGQRVDLTGKEWEVYAKEKGQQSLQSVTELMKTPFYKGATDSVRAKAVSNVYEYANTVAKKKVKPDYTMPNDWTAKAYAAQAQGIPPHTYILFRNAVAENGTTQESVASVLNRIKLTNEQRAYLYALQNPQWKNNPFK